MTPVERVREARLMEINIISLIADKKRDGEYGLNVSLKWASWYSWPPQFRRGHTQLKGNLESSRRTCSGFLPFTEGRNWERGHKECEFPKCKNFDRWASHNLYIQTNFCTSQNDNSFPNSGKAKKESRGLEKHRENVSSIKSEEKDEEFWYFIFIYLF